jgi:hypothetical protein
MVVMVVVVVVVVSGLTVISGVSTEVVSIIGGGDWASDGDWVSLLIFRRLKLSAIFLKLKPILFVASSSCE